MSTVQDYQAAFEKECANTYPMVDAFVGAFDLDRDRLEGAARVLACPVKKSPPNWQHGRVLYAESARYLKLLPSDEWINLLDIGTAKGFSALCLLWALRDSGVEGHVTSVDVIDPGARVARKTIAEIDGLQTLAETLAPWSEAAEIEFLQSTGIDWLQANKGRVHIAFVDGSHEAAVVGREGHLLSDRQQSGDIAVFDDVHRPDLLAAVRSLKYFYEFSVIEALPTRHYAIGWRK